jgi:hypothetical protein
MICPKSQQPHIAAESHREQRKTMKHTILNKSNLGIVLVVLLALAAMLAVPATAQAPQSWL